MGVGGGLRNEEGGWKDQNGGNRKSEVLKRAYFYGNGGGRLRKATSRPSKITSNGLFFKLGSSIWESV